MGEKVARHTAAGHLGVEPPERSAPGGNFLADGVILQVERAVMERPADPPFVHDLLKEGNRGIAAVTEGDHVCHARFFHCLDHLFGFGDTHRERFFADDHLAGVCGFDDHLFMEEIRRDHIDNVDIAAGDQFMPVGFDLFVTPGLPEFFECFEIFRPAVTAFQNRLEGKIGEEVRDLVIRVRVGASHKAATEHTDVERFH